MLKIYASEFPSNFKMPDDIREYIENFITHEGIQMDTNKVQFNAGLRTVSKTSMNCLWVSVHSSNYRLEQGHHKAILLKGDR